MRAIVLSMIAAGALMALAPSIHAKAPDPAHAAAATEGFLKYHPDLRWRKAGLESYEEGRLTEAFNHFKRSARYADKGAQAMVAEMLWKGEGVAADRATAYAWMDLAAERNYKDFAKLREYYWSQLDAADRERALDMGAQVYAEFGDEVAKPRLAQKLDEGRRQITGSRTGFKGGLTVMIPTNGRWVTLDAEQYYKDQFWHPEQYFEWQDQVWKDPYRGTVEVGEVQLTQADKDDQQ